MFITDTINHSIVPSSELQLDLSFCGVWSLSKQFVCGKRTTSYIHMDLIVQSIARSCDISHSTHIQAKKTIVQTTHKYTNTRGDIAAASTGTCICITKSCVLHQVLGMCYVSTVITSTHYFTLQGSVFGIPNRPVYVWGGGAKNTITTFPLTTHDWTWTRAHLRKEKGSHLTADKNALTLV